MRNEAHLSGTEASNALNEAAVRVHNGEAASKVAEEILPQIRGEAAPVVTDPTDFLQDRPKGEVVVTAAPETGPTGVRDRRPVPAETGSVPAEASGIDGMNRAVGISIFTILLVGVVSVAVVSVAVAVEAVVLSGLPPQPAARAAVNRTKASTAMERIRITVTSFTNDESRRVLPPQAAA